MRSKTKYLFEIMMLVVLVSYFWLDQLVCIALFVGNKDVGGVFVRNNDVGGDGLICMAYLFEIKMLVVIVSYFWLDQLICIALCVLNNDVVFVRNNDVGGVFVRNNDVGGGCVLYNWLEQLIPIAREKCKTKYKFEIMMLVVVFEIMMLKCKTKYLLEIMMLVAVVSYLWLDQLISIACEKCKTKYLLEIMMLVVVVSYIHVIGFNS
ncbi:hypothetical protein DPMN_041149 [Dreissena polymorpha]|uniref:Transmembrane protein n=1 Tax=Dreissena polymorpha TaxID=45954 RepID=A0A9D4CYI5_DREPO|nr:hypothetical protein DPMN_041149 [Dreissena polymorpha]